MAIERRSFRWRYVLWTSLVLAPVAIWILQSAENARVLRDIKAASRRERGLVETARFQKRVDVWGHDEEAVSAIAASGLSEDWEVVFMALEFTVESSVCYEARAKLVEHVLLLKHENSRWWTLLMVETKSVKRHISEIGWQRLVARVAQMADDDWGEDGREIGWRCAIEVFEEQPVWRQQLIAAVSKPESRAWLRRVALRHGGKALALELQ